MNTNQRLLNLAIEYNFTDYLKELVLNNRANMAPYHNYYHISKVVTSAHDIYSTLDKSYDEMRVLLIAALFHDFNHTQGLATDNYNIDNSIDCMRKIICGKELVPTAWSIEHIIRGTQYPYGDYEPDLEQQVMRDADLSQICTDNFWQQNVLGLSAELRVPLEKFIPGQYAFLKGVKFYTSYAKGQYEQIVKDKLIEIEGFAKLLGITLGYDKK